MNFDNPAPSIQIALLVLAAVGVVWLFGQLMELIVFFWDTILIFFLAWLLTFTLRPLVDALSQDHAVTDPTGNVPLWERLGRWRGSRGLVTTVVYTALLLVLLTAGILVIPVAVTQFGQLAGRLPAYGAEVIAFFQQLQANNPVWLERLSQQAGEFGVNLEDAYRSIDLVGSAQSIAARLAQNTLGVATGFATVLADMFLVMIISFYMTLDTPRLSRGFIGIVPQRWQDECEVLFKSVDRTFGGFIRSQLLMALISTLGTLVVMQAAGLGFVVVVSLFAGLVMLIPYIGAPIALFLPTLIALFQSGLTPAILVFLALLALQQLVLHIMMPRIMSETMGMHPLMVFAALFIGVRVAGFWGALFGIPVVGVLAAMLNHIYTRNVLGVLAAGPQPPAVQTEANTPSEAPARVLEEREARS
jgi:predicted PurR-regulated permease PerM